MAVFKPYATSTQGLDLSTEGFQRQYTHFVDTTWDASTTAVNASPLNPDNFAASSFSCDGLRYLSLELEDYRLASGKVFAPTLSQVFIQGDPDSAAKPEWYLNYRFYGDISLDLAAGTVAGTFSAFTRTEKTLAGAQSSWQAEGGSWSYKDYGNTSEQSGSAIHSLIFSGDDHITGTSLGDRISGGPGNDTIIGGGGNDQLFDGGGFNTFYGGEGADSFYLQATGSPGRWTKTPSASDHWWETRRVRVNRRVNMRKKWVTEYLVDNQFDVVADFIPFSDNLYLKGAGAYEVSNGGIALWDKSEPNCIGFLSGVSEVQYLSANLQSW